MFISPVIGDLLFDGYKIYGDFTANKLKIFNILDNSTICCCTLTLFGSIIEGDLYM